MLRRLSGDDDRADDDEDESGRRRDFWLMWLLLERLDVRLP